MNEIEPSLGRMHTYWKDKRVRQPGGPIQDEFRLGGQKEVGQVVRGGPKVGPQRSVSLWQWQEIQEVLWSNRRFGRVALSSVR
jgi:hypothetical protein